MKKHKERLLESIRRVAHEHDAAWDALADGTLPETEQAALREEVKRSPAMAEAYELFRPLDPAVKQAMAARVAATLAAARRRRQLWVAVALAAAVLIVFIAWPRRSKPIPEYHIEVAGGEQALLGERDDAGTPLLLEDPDSRLEVALRPATNVKEVIAVHAWLVRDHRATPWNPRIEIKDNGVVRVAGSKRELFQGIAPGSWELVFAVGRPDALPGDAEILTNAGHPGAGRACEPLYCILRTSVLLHGEVELGGEFELGGCETVRALGAGAQEPRGIACEIPASHTLKLWVKAPPDAVITVTVDAAPVSSAGTPVQGGQRFVVPVPDGARTLAVTVQSGAQASSFSTPLVTGEHVAALEQAEALRQAQPEEAKALLLPLLSDERKWVRARAMGKLARIERDMDKKRTLFHDAMDLHHETGWISEEVRDSVTLANSLIDQRAFAEAQNVLARIAPLEQQFPEGRSLALFYRALLALSVGNLRAAVRFFDASKEIAERLDYQAHLTDVLQREAEVLMTLGRSADAKALDQDADILSRQARPCQRAQFLDNAGWHAILAAESLEGVAADLPDPLPKLREALTIYEKLCIQPGAKSGNLTNLAIASIQQGRVDEARDYLKQARQVLPDAEANAENKAWRMIVEARIARATTQPQQALSKCEQIVELAARESLPDAMVRAALGRAQALDSLGRVAEAREAYAGADALLDGWSLLAPLGEGREKFLARYEASTRERVDFLVRRAERERAPAAWIEEAAATARRGRVRILSSLQWLDRLDALSLSERGRWEKSVAEYRVRADALRAAAENNKLLAADVQKSAIVEQERESKLLRDAFEEALSKPNEETPSMPPHPAAEPSLPAPAPGEVLLLAQPIEQGWVGFAITHEGVVFHRLTEMAPRGLPEQIAARLIEQFSDVLDGAARIRFAPHGRLSGVDFHKLFWKGQPLLDRFPVTYGLDLSRASGAEPSPGATPLAILVANPSGDAPGTSRAAGYVEKALEKSGWRVELIQGEAATHDAVRKAIELPDVQLFFYAGHGFYKGRDGLESGLRLAGGSGFTVVDVMALKHVPPRVVLSACETAKTDNDTPVEGLGLAQAFVLAGADEVVATARPVADKLAARMMGALYGEKAGGARLAGRDLPAALREAQRAVAKEDAAGDWAAFRVLVP